MVRLLGSRVLELAKEHFLGNEEGRVIDKEVTASPPSFSIYNPKIFGIVEGQQVSFEKLSDR
jgi:hypothetical protein